MIDKQKEEQRAKLLGSLIEFNKFFLKYITNRDYIIGEPIDREPHQITICRELTRLTRSESDSSRLAIHIPPGYGKTLHICMWIAWSYAQYPDSNFLYISYSHTLASKQTAFIKNIMSSRMYQYLFDVRLSQETRAKDHFSTTAAGTTAAFGSSGSITGRDAGLPALDRFSGAVVIDDPIKPDDVHSDVIRESVIRNYEETIRQRVRGHNVPIIFIGQRLHEDDLAAYLLGGNDTREWKALILPALDDKGHALYPQVQSAEELEQLKQKSPYVFASQYQQNPIPAGGGLFKRSWFVLTDEIPDIKHTFITIDTAETSKTYNDATAMSFWGVYEIQNFGRPSGIYGLHWIDAIEVWIEPKDLQATFWNFVREACRFKVPPKFGAIEKKSTGVTLISQLSDARGIEIRQIERNRASGNKTDRFLKMQPYIASKQLSITKDAQHCELVLDHMTKITANNVHKRDDLCDTCFDAIEIALINKEFGNLVHEEPVVNDWKRQRFNELFS